MQYHFSVLFTNGTIKLHGEFEQKKDFIKEAKAELKKKLPLWKREEKDVIEFEIYNNDRKIVFNYKKC